jgi:hypothetical protein
LDLTAADHASIQRRRCDVREVGTRSHQSELSR